jgi:hypothetical protein
MINIPINKPGTYRCKVTPPTLGWFGEQGEKQTPYIGIPLVVDDDSEQHGNTIYWKGWLSSGAVDFTIKALAKAFPLWNGSLTDLENGDFSFSGSLCEITCVSETYKDKTSIKVQWLNPVGGGGGYLSPIDTQKLSGLLGKLEGRAKALVKAERSSPEVAKRASKPMKEEHDDIPY